MPCDVFISYTSEKDLFGQVSDFRKHLENALQGTTGKRDLVVFQDTAMLGLGDVYPEVLADNLRSAKVLLILLSPGWLAESKWCIREYNIFKQSMTEGSGKTIAPVVWYSVDGLNLLTEQRGRLKEIQDNYDWVHWEAFKHVNWNATNSEILYAAIEDLAKHLKRYFPLNSARTS